MPIVAKTIRFGARLELKTLQVESTPELQVDQRQQQYYISDGDVEDSCLALSTNRPNSCTLLMLKKIMRQIEQLSDTLYKIVSSMFNKLIADCSCQELLETNQVGLLNRLTILFTASNIYSNK